jgi:3-oxoacyl-[acyl-carrier-protein] synthase II
MKRRRVKITGIGPVTPAGIGRDEFWKGILEPVSRVRVFSKIDEKYGAFVATYIDDFDLADYADATRLPKGSARHTVFAAAGAALAVKDAGLTEAELGSASTVVITGSSIMDFGGIISSIDSVSQRGTRGALPRVLFNIGIGSVANAINQLLGINARTVALSNQCCSGMDAIGYAASLIARGEADIAICGGTEAPLHRFPLIELRAAELTPASTDMPERLARPFDLWRTTGVVGEGACMFVLEAESSSRRGYSFISGYGFANDEGNDLCGGMVTAAKLAAADAGIRVSEIEAISAWGPGHKLVDKGEADAMRRLFGDQLDGIPTASIKAAVGTPLGAAPAIQVAASALAQRYSVLPPTVNWEFPDPDCRLCLSNRPRENAHQLTLINSHGLGAVNSGMILERCS